MPIREIEEAPIDWTPLPYMRVISSTTEKSTIKKISTPKTTKYSAYGISVIEGPIPDQSPSRSDSGFRGESAESVEYFSDSDEIVSQQPPDRYSDAAVSTYRSTERSASKSKDRNGGRGRGKKTNTESSVDSQKSTGGDKPSGRDRGKKPQTKPMDGSQKSTNGSRGRGRGRGKNPNQQQQRTESSVDSQKSTGRGRSRGRGGRSFGGKPSGRGRGRGARRD